MNFYTLKNSGIVEVNSSIANKNFYILMNSGIVKMNFPILMNSSVVKRGQ